MHVRVTSSTHSLLFEESPLSEKDEVKAVGRLWKVRRIFNHETAMGGICTVDHPGLQVGLPSQSIAGAEWKVRRCERYYSATAQLRMA